MAQFNLNGYTGEVPDATEYLRDNYRNHGLLCSGGYGLVLRVSNRTTEEMLVAKELLRIDLPGEVERAKTEKRAPRRTVSLPDVMREIDCLAILVNNDSFAQIRDFFYDDTYFYIIEEIIDGGDLFDAIAGRINRGEAYLESDARNIVRSLLLGISHMHSLNIVHRDLKPENILVRSNQKYVICDFGLVIKLDNNNSKTNERAGSTNFKAPEQINDYYGKEVDMWALGVITFIIVAGHYPFMHNNESESRDRRSIEQRILDPTYPYFNRREIWNSAHSARNFVEKCLHRDPTMRLTANEALQHPWITGAMVEPNIELTDAVIGIRSLSERRRAINILKHKVIFLTRLNILMRRRRRYNTINTIQEGSDEKN